MNAAFQMQASSAKNADLDIHARAMNAFPCLRNAQRILNAVMAWMIIRWKDVRMDTTAGLMYATRRKASLARYHHG